MNVHTYIIIYKTLRVSICKTIRFISKNGSLRNNNNLPVMINDRCFMIIFYFEQNLALLNN